EKEKERKEEEGKEEKEEEKDEEEEETSDETSEEEEGEKEGKEKEGTDKPHSALDSKIKQYGAITVDSSSVQEYMESQTCSTGSCPMQRPVFLQLPEHIRINNTLPFTLMFLFLFLGIRDLVWMWVASVWGVLWCSLTISLQLSSFNPKNNKISKETQPKRPKKAHISGQPTKKVKHQNFKKGGIVVSSPMSNSKDNAKDTGKGKNKNVANTPSLTISTPSLFSSLILPLIVYVPLVISLLLFWMVFLAIKHHDNEDVWAVITSTIADKTFQGPSGYDIEPKAKFEYSMLFSLPMMRVKVYSSQYSPRPSDLGSQGKRTVHATYNGNSWKYHTNPHLHEETSDYSSHEESNPPRSTSHGTREIYSSKTIVGQGNYRDSDERQWVRESDIHQASSSRGIKKQSLPPGLKLAPIRGRLRKECHASTKCRSCVQSFEAILPESINIEVDSISSDLLYSECAWDADVGVCVSQFELQNTPDDEEDSEIPTGIDNEVMIESISKGHFIADNYVTCVRSERYLEKKYASSLSLVNKKWKTFAMLLVLIVVIFVFIPATKHGMIVVRKQIRGPSTTLEPETPGNKKTLLPLTPRSLGRAGGNLFNKLFGRNKKKKGSSTDIARQRKVATNSPTVTKYSYASREYNVAQRRSLE
ncbi:hypothetical protein ADUPG1_009643, partial [Aduncisulcus paluster]